MKPNISIVLSCMLLCTCTSFLEEPNRVTVTQEEPVYTGEIITKRTPKPTGNAAVILSVNDMEYRGELVAVNDTMLFFVFDNHLMAVPLSNVRKIHLIEQSVKAEKMASMTTLVLLDGALSFLFISTDHLWWGIPFGLLIPATVVAFLKSNPKVDYSSLLAKRDRDDLGLRCRYPQRLTEDQWKQLLQYYKQEEFIRP